MPIEYSISSIRASARAPAGLVLLMRDARRGRARNALPVAEAARPDDRARLLRRDEFEWRLARALESMQDGDGHALLFMDFNGPLAGDGAADRALGELAEQLRAQVREHDSLARIGDHQLELLLEHCPPAIARERARALQTTVANHVSDARDGGVMLDVSIGIAAVCDRRHHPAKVLAAAQTACARARQMYGGTHIGEVRLD
jgi:diguanylate cyclase (GGDEF)-like protein